MRTILAADIGGTNGRFAVFTVSDAGDLSMGESVWLETKACASFAEMIAKLGESGLPLLPQDADAVGIAIAGPIENGSYCKPPNIDWDVDLAGRDSRLLPHYTLINDFTAQAWACLTPAVADALEILEGRGQGGTIAVIGAGTGLGKAALVPDGRGGYVVMPTEGGHTLYPFVSREEFEFLDFVRERTGRRQIIGDIVVSGLGLSLIHEFFTGERLAPSEVAAGFYSKSKVLAWAARFYGRACRDLALGTLAQGGVFVSGGVAAKAPELVTHPAFSDAFLYSETHADLLQYISVKLNVNEDSGLWGAAFSAMRTLENA